MGEKGVCIMWGGKEIAKRKTTEQGEGPEIEIYTDGSARKGKAGWGMVVVLEEEEFESRKGPVETASKTNNVGEVMAVQQAIRWAVEQSQSVKIRYDSKYAANMVQGTWKCKKGRNIELIREAREEYRKGSGHNMGARKSTQQPQTERQSRRARGRRGANVPRNTRKMEQRRASKSGK